MAEGGREARIYRFEGFVADASERRLLRDGAPLDISSRYFDALLLLLGEPGRLVSRERFLDEVWRGVPVTDEALSQCIAYLRRLLEDDAARPRFIETVPKHGYRFIAPVEAPSQRPTLALGSRGLSAPLQIGVLTAAGTLGGGLAGIGGGLLYGLGVSPDPAQAEVGAASFLLVMLSVNILAGAIGGLAVGAGIGIAHRLAQPSLVSSVAGAAAAGLIVGLAAKLLGTDVFHVLLGTAPRGIAGGFEGMVLAAAVALGSHVSLGKQRPWPSIRGAALVASLAGAVLPLLGGRLMAGSLAALSDTFAGAPLDMDSLGRWFGEDRLGTFSQSALGAIEGLFFGAGIAFAIRQARALLRDMGAP